MIDKRVMWFPSDRENNCSLFFFPIYRPIVPVLKESTTVKDLIMMLNFMHF